ncbi:integrin alpha-PS5-like [Oratosquilla oratoria]|uniref:integrin alpha-PS5-like n=1 Tax=Oratosquilla oratoria TaxID=337810 RepID=UPI003F76DED8
MRLNMAMSRVGGAILVLCACHSALAFNLATDFVDIFDDPTREVSTRESYFGFAVGLMKVLGDESYWLLVGAPRANSTVGKYDPTEITEPGVFFKCDLSDPGHSCIEVVVDPMGNEEMGGDQDSRYHNRRNFGWLGGSIDTQPGIRNTAVTCAPRWQNQRYPETYHIGGSCYWINSSLEDYEAHKMVPLISRGKQHYEVERDKFVFYHAHGQAGFSVHYPDKDGEMILGAPGVFNWRGTVVRAQDYHPGGPGGISRRRRSLSLRQRRQVSFEVNEYDMFSDYLVPNPYSTSDVNDFSLLGYSVTSGRFSTDVIRYVAGAPKGAMLFGKVLVFLFPLDDSRQFNIWAQFEGSQLGEYFGASVAAPDLTGTGLSDLVVGAPLHAVDNAPDVGRVYVYINKEGTLELSSKKYFGSLVSGARFGTTLMAPGDLNKDNFGDLLVGAPYEDDGVGAVYVYLGSSDGLRSTFSQRLSPLQMTSWVGRGGGGGLVPDNIRGFGMSISRGVDVDRNGYIDIAVGSYESGHVVLLRSRSVARLEGQLSTSPSRLRLEERDFVVTSCISYSGFRVPETVEVAVRVTLDAGLPNPRAVLSSGLNYAAYNATVRSNVKACHDHNAKVMKGVADPRQPIQMRLEYHLASEGPFKADVVSVTPPESSSPRRKRQLNPINPPPLSEPKSSSNSPFLAFAEPVTDPQEQRSSSGRISFVTGCEDDGIPSCVADLVVEASFDLNGESHFEIGSSPRIMLMVDVINYLEPAFLPNLTVTVPSPLDIVEPTSHPCNRLQEELMVTLTCDLVSPIKEGASDSVKIELDVSALSDRSPPSVTVNVEAQSGSEVEVNPSDNFKSLTLDLVANADLRILGASAEEQVVYSRIDSDTINTTDLLTTIHTITVVKKGPTPVHEVNLEVEIPINITTPDVENENFAQIFLLKKQFRGEEFMCTLEGGSFSSFITPARRIHPAKAASKNTLALKNEEKEVEEEEDKVEDEEQEEEPLISMETILWAYDKNKLQKEKEKTVAIWSGWWRVKKAVMKCSIRDWPAGGDSASLKFHTKLNMTVLGQVMSAKKGAEFITSVTATLSSVNYNLPQLGSKIITANITTRLVPGLLPGEAVPWWVILLAVLAGLLLLFLLAYGLYKFGFFKREKQEQMREHQAAIFSGDFDEKRPMNL